ncbi:hypothetical protein C9J03_18580 [Photobacterium gaetbulicola]|uniref:Lipoprotein n=1 Tax=Photobacterium gaetbulicola Gung47 TaxID=658445 RepID=A0A0C5WML8_9GAMM|nr:hypothetical protein [Photobacterium gaetbulicola]AJR07582.1 hypothetical protein H744_2c0867 [Photobacterium gaetbulicola Gung47]PSU04458.1 hypothetical protein C9J03_18580 [Photobacterium gaetbulicola]
MNKFTIASVAVATALLAGCGGSSSSGGDKDLDLPTGGEAEVCFNPVLWQDASHEATWQTRWSEEADFYPQTERTQVTNGVDFEEHKSITQVEYISNYSETPLGFEVESNSHRLQQSRNGSSQRFDYYVIDEQSTSVSYAGDQYVNDFDGIVEDDRDVNSPAAPQWLFGSEQGQTTKAVYTSEFSLFIDGELEERLVYGQTKRDVTFNGIEMIDVNGKSVETCSFSIDSTLAGNADGEVWTGIEQSEQWIDKETGLMVKSIRSFQEIVDGMVDYESYEEKLLEAYAIDGEVIFSIEDKDQPAA